MMGSRAKVCARQRTRSNSNMGSRTCCYSSPSPDKGKGLGVRVSPYPACWEGEHELGKQSPGRGFRGPQVAAC